MRDAEKQGGGVANEVSDAASQVADAATNAARKTASSFEKACACHNIEKHLTARSRR
jgi:hypothetical protein